MSDLNLTARRVRFSDSGLVIEIAYDGDKPITARAVDAAPDWADNPDTVRAVQYALDQAITAYKQTIADSKKRSQAEINAQNATGARGGWAQPSPGEVVEAMKDLDLLNPDNSIVGGHYRAALLEHLKIKHPKLSKSMLADRITAAKKLQLLT